MIRYSYILYLLLIFLDCGNLTIPGDGSVNLTSTTFGSQARYSCNTGYYLVGIEIRVCEATGNWSDAAPICQIKGNEINFVYINR